jgi:hypothetical protein
MKIILDKGKAHWEAVVDGDGPYQISSTSDVKAADVLVKVRRCNPGATIGIKSSVFGPATQLEFGDIVWMK